MFSPTQVSSDAFHSGQKEINESLIPSPYSGTGTVHRAHTTHFNLGSFENNSMRAVNAPSWANYTVDSFVEEKTQKTAGKLGDGSTFHYRFDTHDRSTVGNAVDRGEELDDQRRWKVVMTQYGRK